MAAARSVNMLPVGDNPQSISPAARTINLAFSQDPLIEWLRPNAIPWGSLSRETCKWQYRRIQQAILDGIVLSSPPLKQMVEVFPPRAKSLVAAVEEPLSQTANEESLDAGIAMLLFPPQSFSKWTIKRILLACKLWALDFLDPATDSEACERRVDTLLTSHDIMMDKIRARYAVDDVWYLEVLAVHPLLQSRGMGSKSMQWLLEYVDNSPIVLECTSERNVKFYERWGFEVVEEVELGEEERVTLWVMLRPTQP